jgi:hypothetical protein
LLPLHLKIIKWDVLLVAVVVEPPGVVKTMGLVVPVGAIS